MNLENPRLEAMIEEDRRQLAQYNAYLIDKAVETLRRLAPEKLREDLSEPRKAPSS